MLTRIAPRIGVALALAACLVVGWRLESLWQQVSSLLIRRDVLLCSIGLSVVYAGSLFLLATTWALLITRWRSPALPALVRAYGISSIAKYLPGNVFHLAGRHLVAGKLGIPHTALAVATITEIALSVVTALVVAACFLLAADGASEIEVHHGNIWIPSTVGVVIIAIVLRAGSGRSVRRSAEFGSSTTRTPRSLFAGGLLSAAFFLISALIAMTCGYMITGAAQHFPAIASASIIAWLVGFITPGISGGLGVREATLLLLLSPLIGDAEGLSLAIMIRLITTAGDVIFMAASHFLLGSSSNGTKLEMNDSGP